MINTAALALFVPLPLLGAVALLRRRWRLLSLLLVPALLGAQLYGARFWPRVRPAVPASTPRITAMTFNVLYRNRDDDALRTAIPSIGGDLVGLQEVTPKRARWLATTFAAAYPYMAFRVDGPEAGVALLSRYPIIEVTRFALPPEIWRCM